MNNLPSSSDPILRQLVELSDDTVRRARVRTRSLYHENRTTAPSQVRPLLHLVPSPKTATMVADLFEQGMGYYHGADPLAPLRDRDLRVLDAWFTDTEMSEIEADIVENLQYRFPEPCWEDYALSFLEGFL